MSGITFSDAVAYAEWRARRDKLPWRLPRPDEWQLAAQGGDGRAYPWGDRPDLGACWSYQTNRGKKLNGEARVGQFPLDRSEQGVFDLAGSLSEFVDIKVGNAAARVKMGGNFSEYKADHFSSWFRQDHDYRWVSPVHGFRLVLDLHDHPGNP